MAGKLGDAGQSRLAQIGSGTAQPTESLKVTTRKANTPKPKAFRFSPQDIERLRALSERLGEAAGRRVTDVDILRGLLLLGEKADSKKLLSAIKDALFPDP
ncbi:MAG: hypothetical protein KDJ34_16590 [Candidatus Competibacteraceae bacterium]|nr:hypothetical protein [Candidatus Competibacteraceae bacterium]